MSTTQFDAVQSDDQWEGAEGTARTSKSLPEPIVPPGPHEFVKQLTKLTNTVFGAATVSLVRSFVSPATAPPPPPGGAAAPPRWMREQWTRSSALQGGARRFVVDTAAFTAASYIMEGGEAWFQFLRGGTDDALNKMLGGAAAGGGLGTLWYGWHRPIPSAILVVCGAMAGFTSFSIDKAVFSMMLEKQMSLEKELLHKTDDELRTKAEPYYLRELMLMKQQQFIAQQRQAEEAAGARRMAAERGGAAPGGRPDPAAAQRGFAASAPSINDPKAGSEAGGSSDDEEDDSLHRRMDSQAGPSRAPRNANAAGGTGGYDPYGLATARSSQGGPALPGSGGSGGNGGGGNSSGSISSDDSSNSWGSLPQGGAFGERGGGGNGGRWSQEPVFVIDEAKDSEFR